MKIIQLNTWGGRLGNNLTRFIDNEKADILCLQEVISVGNGSVGVFTSLEQLQESGNYTNVFLSPVFSFSLMHRTARFGNAIITNYKAEETDTIFTNLEHKDNFDFNIDDYNVRNLQHMAILIDGKQLHILNHHGHHVPSHKNGDEQTLRQMNLISEYIRQLKGPIILCGDFNLSPDSKSLKIINNQMQNLPVKYGLTTTRTSFTHKKEVCDYIFVSDEIRITKFSASKEIVSDHQALILEFDL